MSYEPLMDGRTATNVYEEHQFKLRVLFGSSAVTSYLGKDLTFARNSAGNYSITLPKPYTAITSFSWGMTDASGAILFCVIVNTTTVSTTGVVIIETRTEAGTATDPTAGEYLYLQLGVSCNDQNALYGG